MYIKGLEQIQEEQEEEKEFVKELSYSITYIVYGFLKLNIVLLNKIKRELTR
jgi:hypothetical protein